MGTEHWPDINKQPLKCEVWSGGRFQDRMERKLVITNCMQTLYQSITSSAVNCSLGRSCKKIGSGPKSSSEDTADLWEWQGWGWRLHST